MASLFRTVIEQNHDILTISKFGLFVAIFNCKSVLEYGRTLLWELGQIHVASEGEMALVALESDVDLPLLTDFEREVWDHELTGLSTTGQFMRFYRPALQRIGAVTIA